MAISLDKALGIHPAALQVGERRIETIASNLANADTPHYKARDIDFRAALQNAQGGDGTHLRATRAGHFGAAQGSGPDFEIAYRTPNQPSLDGNTVDSQLEQSAFAENAVRYQASLDFLDSRISGIRRALRGE